MCCCSAHSEVGLAGQRDGTEVRLWGALSDVGVRQLVGTVVREGFQRGSGFEVEDRVSFVE